LIIRESYSADFAEMLAIINDAARAYRGVIPADRWHEPYMPAAELAKEIAAGVVFWVAEHDGRVVGVMGIQDKFDVHLIRHAYVRTRQRQKGIGSLLLKELIEGTDKPILIGTWKAAEWAIRFYEKQGFCLVEEGEKNGLLKNYWTIQDRQVETSVVLVDEKYKK